MPIRLDVRIVEQVQNSLFTDALVKPSIAPLVTGGKNDLNDVRY
jgi:hypothetical protein